MKKIIIKGIAVVVVLFVFTHCQSKIENKAVIDETLPKTHSVIVKEVLSATSYTYLFVSEGEKEYWIAIPSMNVEVGKTYSFENPMEMKNFESKDLKRTFETIYFVEGIVDLSLPLKNEDEVKNPHNALTQTGDGGETKTQLLPGITLTKGAISLHDLFSTKDNLAGKTVTLTGKVVNYNPDIMNKNWIHMQDGSSFNGFNDVVVTTLAKVAVDDIISIKGVVSLNKDLGYGYKYDVLIEDATLVK